MSSIDPIARAIDYANRPEHAGAGYTLRVYTVGCKVPVDVSVFGSSCDYRLESVSTFARIADEGPVFFHPANVARVDVLW